MVYSALPCSQVDNQVGSWILATQCFHKYTYTCMLVHFISVGQIPKSSFYINKHLQNIESRGNSQSTSFPCARCAWSVYQRQGNDRDGDLLHIESLPLQSLLLSNFVLFLFLAVLGI